jgi:hypothetical protein
MFFSIKRYQIYNFLVYSIKNLSMNKFDSACIVLPSSAPILIGFTQIQFWHILRAGDKQMNKIRHSPHRRIFFWQRWGTRGRFFRAHCCYTRAAARPAGCVCAPRRPRVLRRPSVPNPLCCHHESSPGHARGPNVCLWNKGENRFSQQLNKHTTFKELNTFF